MLPHLGAAFTLARYLLRDPADAEDAVQEAYLQALRYFAGFRGENARAWLLTIVRRVCYGWIERTRRQPWADPELVDELPGAGDDPETAFLHAERQEQLARAVDALPFPFREVIVLARDPGAVLPGDRDRDRSTGRNGDVAPRPCTAPAATRPRGGGHGGMIR